VSKVLGDGHVGGCDVNANGLVVARDTLTAPADLFTVSGGKAQRVTHFNAERLKDVAMGQVEWFDFKGWNDERVQGYAVKPWNYEKGKKYPVAFIVHGGPQGAMGDDFHYRWNPQTYAGQGFAVVTINFHGSTGYGQAFTDAISQHWGDRPLEDLQKGWSAALGKFDYLDGGRACELGASYGGFMTFWIAGNWQQPWKCQVAHDGVFDSRMMSYSTEELWFDEWEHGATQYDNPASYEQFNPIAHVAKWKVPMLVVHGEKDYRIPYEQGLAAFTALQRRGIDSEFLVFPDENHWVLKPQNSVKWHNTVNAWLKRWTESATK
jgi:dipeptidyl aminopeptidase/acylaminoacyl peptidase